MADFVQTMKDWRRMCKYYDEKTGDNSCDFCPLNGCNAIYEDDGNTDYSDIEEKVAAWAAEHPEPVYETWGQYFRQYYGLEYCTGHEMLLENIPADIAQKLGLQPKEG